MNSNKETKTCFGSFDHEQDKCWDCSARKACYDEAEIKAWSCYDFTYPQKVREAECGK